jgi:hypothetical protein
LRDVHEISNGGLSLLEYGDNDMKINESFPYRIPSKSEEGFMEYVKNFIYGLRRY